MMKKIVLFCVILGVFNSALVMAAQHKNGAGGLPLPRFVSIRSSEANLRIGPGHHFPTEWTYERARLPVEIIAEFGDWRKVRDYEGTQGWFHKTLLSGQRYIIVLKDKLLLKKQPDPDAKTIASFQNGTIAHLLKCEKDWCHVHFKGTPSIKGWLERIHIWGVNEND